MTHPFSEVQFNSSLLNLSQTKRLFALLDSPILISSRSALPTLTVIPSLFLIRLQHEAKQRGLAVHDIRLSGGAASFVLDPAGDLAFRDLDFLISVHDVRSESHWTLIKQAVFTSLPLSMKDNSGLSTELYTDKMIRILHEHDRWGLISLRNVDGRNLELKFVEHMKRQYQFSVDSFQILLDPLLNYFYLTKKFDSYPPILVLSSYGNFSEALQHLHYRLIAVKAPEELRGGGLLKYCDLIARGFRPTNQIQMKDLQRYMCSRFFIDFRDSLTQEQVLFKYVTSHFGIDYDVRYRFLWCLYDVISTDSVWLSAFERICFLKTISTMYSSIMPFKVANCVKSLPPSPSAHLPKKSTLDHKSPPLSTSITKHSPTLRPADQDRRTPSVPSSNTLIKSSCSSSEKSTNLVRLSSSSMASLSLEQIDVFVQIVNSLRTELFPKLNNFLSSM